MPIVRKNQIDSTRVLKEFGQAVKNARLARGFSQEELALDADLDLTSVNEIEKGHRSPKLITVCKIALGLKMSASDLIKEL